MSDEWTPVMFVTDNAITYYEIPPWWESKETDGVLYADMGNGCALLGKNMQRYVPCGEESPISSWRPCIQREGHGGSHFWPGTRLIPGECCCLVSTEGGLDG